MGRDVDAAGIRLAVSGALLGLLGVGIRVARPADIGWLGVAVALAWGAAAIVAGVMAVRGAAWGASLGVALLSLALLGLGALGLKVARGPDPASGLAGVLVVAGALATSLWGLAPRARLAIPFFRSRPMRQA